MDAPLLAPATPPATAAAPLLSVAGLRVSAGGRVLLDDFSLELRPGEFLAVLGRNGSGKSLTLHTLAGLRPAAAGRVALGSGDMRALARGEIARRLGFLPQDREEALPLSVFEAALLGRHPHIGWLRNESARDLQVVHSALARLGVDGCAERALATLSGGEQRRAAMAGLLAQEPQVYLLDEPTNHLDPHHQVDVLFAFRERCAAGAAVVATLHDPALAERCADRVLLMYGDGRWRLGAATAVLNAGELSELYATPMNELRGGGRRAFIPA
jgi:iron complex transport system ATP-binding protein